MNHKKEISGEDSKFSENSNGKTVYASIFDELVSPESNPSELVQRLDKQELLLKALSQLKEDHTDLLKKFYFEGKSAEQIAKNKGGGATQNNVLQALFYARNKLKEVLERMGIVSTEQL